MAMFDKILVFGTFEGVTQVLEKIQINRIKAVIAPSIRPKDIFLLKELLFPLDIPLLIQPKYNTLEYNFFIQKIKLFKYDSVLSNCYSMIIRPDVLEYCNYNAINIHWSLLPLNRGPNPVQWALIKGETYTGVTLHFIDDGVDTGDIVEQIEVTIDDDDTWVSLNHKLKKASDNILEIGINNLISGNFKRRQQLEINASTNMRLDPNYPRIDLSKMSNTQIYNLIRAQIQPLKGAFIESNNERINFPNLLTKKEIQEMRLKYGQ